MSRMLLRFRFFTVARAKKTETKTLRTGGAVDARVAVGVDRRRFVVVQFNILVPCRVSSRLCLRPIYDIFHAYYAYHSTIASDETRPLRTAFFNGRLGRTVGHTVT